MGRTNRLGKLRSFISIPVHDSFAEDVAILRRAADERDEDFAPFLRRYLRRLARTLERSQKRSRRSSS